MVSFWGAVVDRLTPDITGGESEDALRDMRRGCAALAGVVWDLRSDTEHPLARALVDRIGVQTGGVRTMPDVWLARVDEWLAGRGHEIRVAEGEAREEADLAWRTEAVRRVVRKRRRGEPVTYGEVAEEMNRHPGRGRRPWLSAGGGCAGRTSGTRARSATSLSLTRQAPVRTCRCKGGPHSCNRFTSIAKTAAYFHRSNRHHPTEPGDCDIV